jgi:hypothetical protein
MYRFRLPELIFIIFGFFPSITHSQVDRLPHYHAKKIRKSITIDGKIDERIWEKAKWTNDFVDITGDKMKKPRFSTKCKILWDEEHLYIAAHLEEPHLYATLNKHDDIIYREHDFEVFLDPGADQTNYFEIEVNALNTTMELFMNKPYKKGGTYDMNWNAEGMVTAVNLKGSLNDQNDIDSGWTLEMKIPFTALEKENRPYKPKRGSTWRINFSRVEWDMEMKDGNYTVKKNVQGKKLPEDNWVWSPIGVVNMHIPEKWGYLTFK